MTVSKHQSKYWLRFISTPLLVLLLACGGSGGFEEPDEAITPAPESTSNNRVQRLKNVERWMYQIQELNLDGAVELLAATDYPMLVIEPGHNFKEDSDVYETANIISQLRNTPSGSERLLLAYIDIGEAEDYRDYWQDEWVAPTESTGGSPDFLITVDPDGWSGNYPVAYWRSEWQALWLGNSGIIAELAELGFDGIYLDWVEAYDDESVREFATSDGIADPDGAMVEFVERLRTAGQTVTEDFLVVAQNAPYLIDYDIENNSNRYANAIDGVSMEDTWFYGEGDVDWDDANAGDLSGDERQQGDFSTENRLLKYADFQNRGLPVFTVDYCISNETAETAYTESRNAGLIPLVTRVSLSRVTETPPEDF
ncbi:MAG: endo alpha-1,4 polygalactosaminidase [Kangiellaceae bacterium]|nr:endo alpha-1,4 polygalactosaminidase [Kangiellaceae bacterium]